MDDVACSATAGTADPGPVIATRAGDAHLFLVCPATHRIGGTACPEPGAAATAAYAGVAAQLDAAGFEIVHERIFGRLAAAAAILEARARALDRCHGSAGTPVTYVEGAPTGTGGFAGCSVHAVRRERTAAGVSTVLDEGVACGRSWEDAAGRCIVLQNLTSGAADGMGRATAAVIDRAARILHAQGFSMHDIVRTWFHIHEIVQNYAQFNAARSARYREFGLLPDATGQPQPPASTGIGARLPGDAALALDLWAVTGRGAGRPVVEQLRNPAQQDAMVYGSAFSRGAWLRTPGLHLIEVSGTAAIDRFGRSCHAHDAAGQIACTLANIEALLRQCDADLSNVCAATAYIKNPADVQHFSAALRERGLTRFPAVCVVADVCRDELLFELEAEAARPPA